MIIGLLLLFRILCRILVSTNVEVVFAIIFIRTTKLFTREKISLDFVLRVYRLVLRAISKRKPFASAKVVREAFNVVGWL